MNLLQIQEELREIVKTTANRVFNVEIEQIAVEVPPRTELGDLAFPVAFELAKQIKQQTGEKQNPRAIAEQLKTALETFDFVARVEVAGPGYLNIFYNRAKFLSDNSLSEPLPKFNLSENTDAPKVCVEHTSLNPNKAAHIGHVRNSVLGDTFVRILRATGKRVEIQNYIDNTGVQVADVVVGFVQLRKMNLEQIKQLDAFISERASAAGPDKADYSLAQSYTNSKISEEYLDPAASDSQFSSFDFYCWDLYTEVGKFYARDEENLKFRTAILHELERGEGEIYELADWVATRNVECILQTMERLAIRYDLLPRESEILHLDFWQKAFQLMKERGVIHFETDGKHAGCWVMPFESHTGTDEHEADKILVRSNGTVTYTGKDIAYQMWKLGLLGLDFNYKHFHTYPDKTEVFITTMEKTDVAREFGHGETVYNVIDTRQSYPQEIVRKGVAAIFPEKGETASVHLSYGMVTLSVPAAEELGLSLTEEDKKRPFIEMSGRKGWGVKADELISRLEENAFAEVSKRNPEFSEEKQKRIAHQIAVGALRYFLLKFTKNTVIVFDFKEALAFEGETGVYCQNAAVRFNSIFKKLEDNALENANQIIASESEKVSELFASEIGNDLWSLAALAGRLEETVAQAAQTTEPAVLAKYCFNLSKTMHLFHHNHRIISEENPVKRALLIAVADSARKALTAALKTMGIEVPERM